jgi:DNA helicase-2/ATP-dependent DNA helicase PcrA
VTGALMPTVDDENHWLADTLAQEWHSAEGTPTVAVLLRRRADMAGVAHALRERGLPVEVVGVGGLIDEPEIADIIAMLRLLADHQAGPAAMRILTGARWRLGIADVAALARRARELGSRLRQNRPSGDSADTDALVTMRVALAEALGGDEVDEAGVVDALADPGAPAAYSPEGWRRIAELRGELQRLRDRLTAPLPELIRDIERALRLDIEVLLTADGRAHLDAFGDIVATLAADGAGPIDLLEYLAVAAEREDGLAPGEVDVAQGRIQVLTVHAAKGLEWDVVAVPHLTSGVFPSDMKSTWLGEASGLPPALRGDRDQIPALELPNDADQGVLGRMLKDHKAQWRDRHLIEERRLFYVAVTRARRRVLISAHHWSATRKEPAGPGEFFTELVDGDDHVQPLAEGAAPVDRGADGARPLVTPVICAPAPETGTTNPLLDRPVTGIWPVDPLGTRRPSVEAGARLVRQAIAAGPRGDDSPFGARATGTGDDAGLSGDRDRIPNAPGDVDPDTEGAMENDPDGWFRDVRLLLAERAAASAPPKTIGVDLPAVMSVSALVEMAADSEGLARRLQRPVPRPPSPQARRGTAFHAWLERYYGGEPLLGLAELPGAHDMHAADDERLDELIEAFRGSSWAARSPIAVEVPFVTHVAGIAVRGRIDAVFAEPDGGVCVVDWKTGAPPTPGQAESVAIQLVAYRLAWSRLHGMPLDMVRAAFYYVAHDKTVTPADLLDDNALERLIDDAVGETDLADGDGVPDLEDSAGVDAAEAAR